MSVVCINFICFLFMYILWDLLFFRKIRLNKNMKWTPVKLINNLSTPTPGSLCQKKPEGTTIYPSSISIASLLKAGKLVKPREKNKVTLALENFDVSTQQWVEVAAEEFAIDTQKFSSGAFRDAFRVSTIKPTKCEDWVVKTYNDDAVKPYKRRPIVL